MRPCAPWAHHDLPPKKFESVISPFRTTDRADGELMTQLPDYYAVLGVERSATAAEITRAWRRLVLLVSETFCGGVSFLAAWGQTELKLTMQSHPDKRRAGDVSPVDIVLVNEARAVLSDPGRRKEFDAQYLTSTSSRDVPEPKGPRIREYVSLEEFTPKPDEDEPEEYTLECRCGQDYVITVPELEDGVDVVGCPGCGEYIGVDYEVVEDEE